MEKHEQEQQYRVQRLNEGLGYGDGAISGNPEGVSAEELSAVDRTIEQGPRILVPVDRDKNGDVLDDDGCGDGRSVNLISRGRAFLKRSLNRAKVFGGAAAMAVASRIGIGNPKEDLTDTFEAAFGDLAAAGIDFGAHTDDHERSAHDPNCGCGAIDKAPESVQRVVRYRRQIAETAVALGADASITESVLANYDSYAESIEDKPYSGKAVMDRIVGLGRVVKRLAGGHKEARIVLNDVEGYTVNQELIREVSGGKVQIFAVDLWRMRSIADRLHPNDTEQADRSFVSQVVYTLGVAAVLTKGDLPTYRISAVGAPHAVRA